MEAKSYLSLFQLLVLAFGLGLAIQVRDFVLKLSISVLSLGLAKAGLVLGSQVVSWL